MSPLELGAPGIDKELENSHGIQNKKTYVTMRRFRDVSPVKLII